VQHEDSYNILDQPAAWQYWYTRREFYDDRAAIFATESSGRHESFYLLKVVNPGSFAISPANVQPMYQPGIQATSDLLHLQVDPAPGGGEEMMQAFRGAFAGSRAVLSLANGLGNFLLMLLAAGWLQIPDSHTWQFAFSMLSGVLLVIAFLWLYTATFRVSAPCAARPPHWLSWILLAVFVALWWLLLQPIAAGRAHEGLLPAIGTPNRRRGCAIISATRH
jgi:hypothetical protein